MKAEKIILKRSIFISRIKIRLKTGFPSLYANNLSGRIAPFDPKIPLFYLDI